MDRGESNVLKEVIIDIYRGEILEMVDEYGSGKSMFAAVLLDAVVEQGTFTGDITYYPPGGGPIDLLSLSDLALWQVRWEEILMIFQGAMSAFNPTLSIGGRFEETLDAHDCNIAEGMARARELFGDLFCSRNRYSSRFLTNSRADQKQRVLIALNLILDSEVLVMDEPTGTLGLLMQRSILNLLYEVKDEHDLTIVFISHDLPTIPGFASRIAMMYAFEFVEVVPLKRC